MIIDFHTHTFPASIAKRALETLSVNEGLKPFTDGTNEGLIESMDKAGVDVSVLLPVVTKVAQTEDINRIALSVEEVTKGRLISFGGIHPEDTDYERHLQELKAGGVKGIKLHPVFQRTYFDDIRYKRIIDKACELGLIIMVHAGYDISMPNADYASAPHLINVVRELKPEKMILAHMGSWKNWDEAEEVVGECKDIYIDTSFTISSDGNPFFYDTDIKKMSNEQFCNIVRKIGADKVLFGTDSPWTGQRQSIDAIMRSGISERETDMILGKNACILFGYI
ncbi:MAG: amidohydrolase family protein [Lachnospiraceae bacterium]|nr:amidohydrolase family protein [Lachnospiraceae bacterium]